VKQRFNAPHRDLGVRVSRRDECGKKFHGEVVALLDSATVENQKRWFAVDGDVRVRQFLEIRQGSAGAQHRQFPVTVQRARIFLLDHHRETHFVLGAEPGERARGMTKVRVNLPFRGQGEGELARAVQVLRADQGFVDLGEFLLGGGRFGSLAGTVFREVDGQNVAAVQLHLAIGGFHFNLVGGDARHVADKFRSVLQNNFFRQRGQSRGQEEQTDPEWP
jgi:hypothetical protein